ncbi:MAG: hypothetical protein WA919_12215 [Coleofasciculaceae cyanobacterium]
MNKKREFSQFIYGKFTGRNSGYRLVAYTNDLAGKEQQLTNMAERTYYFWGTQGTEGDKKAVGIFPHSKETLVIVQAAPAVDEQGKLLSSGGSKFDQHRYIFVPRKSLLNLDNQVFILLIRLFNKPIPYFSNLNIPAFAEPDYPWWNLIANLFEPPSSEELQQAKNLQIQECWSVTDNHGQSLLLLALAILLNKQRLLLTLDQNAKYPVSFSESLLMLLPASCRSHIAIAAGAVDEHRCKRANLIVKTNGLPKQPLPDSLIWLERGKKIIIGEHNQKILEHQYVSEFIAPINNQPDKILKLVQHLNTIIDDNFNIESLSNPDSLILLIPGMPEERQVDLWCRYIPQVTSLQSVIEKFSEYPSLWQALIQLVDQHPQYINFLLIIIKKLPEEEVIQKLQTDVLENLDLAVGLLNTSLLNQFPNKSVDTDIGKILIDVCYKAVEYISEQDTVQAWKLASSCINHENLFPSEDRQFPIWDAALKGELEVGTLRVRFNQKLAAQLSHLNRAEILKSNLYKHLQEKLPDVAKSIERLLEQQAKGLVELPKIAEMMQMQPEQADLLYSKFLEKYQASSVSLEDIRPIITNVIEKSIIGIDQSEVTERKINISFHPTLFPKSYQYFEFIDSDLIKIFSALKQFPRSWDNWKSLTSTLYKTSLLERINFLERTVRIFFPTEVLAYWLENISEDIRLDNYFLASSTWLHLHKKDIKKVLIDTPTHAKFIAYLAIKKERFELISEDLLHYLKQCWLTSKPTTPDDQKLWIALTSPSTLKAINNNNWLNIWYLNHLFNQEGRFPAPTTALNQTEKQHLYKLAIKLFNQATKFEQKQRLLNDCCTYGLERDKTKPIAIQLIKMSSNSEQVLSLIDNLKIHEFTFSEQKEVLKSVNPKVCPLDLVFDYLKGTSQEANDSHEIDLIELLFNIPLSSEEDNHKRTDFVGKYLHQSVDKYLHHSKEISALKEIIIKLNQIS